MSKGKGEPGVLGTLRTVVGLREDRGKRKGTSKILFAGKTELERGVSNQRGLKSLGSEWAPLKSLNKRIRKPKKALETILDGHLARKINPVVKGIRGSQGGSWDRIRQKALNKQQQLAGDLAKKRGVKGRKNCACGDYIGTYEVERVGRDNRHHSRKEA